MVRVLLVSISVLLMSCTQEQNMNSIKLNVNQTVKIPVEYVSVSAGIQLRDPDPVEVEKEGYDKLAKTVEVLKALGYEKQQLEIQSGQVRDRSYQEISYQYSSSINFEVYDLEYIDTIRRALIKGGINNFSVTGYNNSKEDSLYDQAYQQAIAQARKQAQKLIQNEAVRIGEIMNLNERVEENYFFVTAMQEEQHMIELDAALDIESVDPLFNKEYYNRPIEFVVEFALESK